ncbi:MAG: YHS domain-containing protein [Candidatus Brocadiaceae bacterium]|jgi:YHS domain-containing protein
MKALLTTAALCALLLGALIVLTGCRASHYDHHDGHHGTGTVQPGMAGHHAEMQPGEVPHAAGSASGEQQYCPVMGGRINENLYVDHGGRRIYFCCAGCIERFRQDPEEYLGKLDEHKNDG